MSTHVNSVTIGQYADFGGFSDFGDGSSDFSDPPDPLDPEYSTPIDCCKEVAVQEEIDFSEAQTIYIEGVKVTFYKNSADLIEIPKLYDYGSSSSYDTYVFLTAMALP